MRFVKVSTKGPSGPTMIHDEWFKVIDKDHPILDQEKEADREANNAGMELIYGDRIHKLSSRSQVAVMSKLSQPRRWTWDRRYVWLLRESKSFMMMDSSTVILDECGSEAFPGNDEFDVVVCENDSVNRYMEKFWPNIFKGKSIFSANNFSNKSLSDVVDLFNRTKVVAFHTTFRDFGWWNLVIEAWKLSDTRPNVIGYCQDDDDWREAQDMAPFLMQRIFEE